MDPLSILALGGIAICYLAVADGVDLGIGILLPLARNQGVRDQLLHGVTPFGRGNEPWLVFGATMLCFVVPIAYDRLPPAFYLPVLAMFSGLILRGVALEFHIRSVTSQRVWTFVFAGGSFVAALCQGLILGACVELTFDRGGHFGSGAFDSFSTLGFLCATVIVDGYALLGIVYWYCAVIAARTFGPATGPMPSTMGLCPAGSNSSGSGDAADSPSWEWRRHRRPGAPSVDRFTPHPKSTRSRSVPAFVRNLAPGE